MDSLNQINLLGIGLVLLAFLIAFILVIIAVPSILHIARAKNIFDNTNERKVHTGNVPPLGGIAIFIGFVLSTIVATDGYTFDSLKYIIASVMLMFFIGLKDDLLTISARKKLVVQLFAGILLITLGNIRFTNLHGILGIYEIHYFTSLIFSLFVMIGIINAFNLIDGIDGLASGLAVVAAIVFGTWFYLSGNIQFSIMSIALAGSLTAFFIFNVFGHNNKLFMGDSGSLIIGLVISALVIRFNEYNTDNTVPFAIHYAPAVSLSVIIIPFVDTIRVITIRIIQGRSPFTPDKNHIHHRLLTLIPNHFFVTLILITVNAIMIIGALLLNNTDIDVNIQFLLVFITGIGFSFIPILLIRIIKLQKKRKSYITA